MCDTLVVVGRERVLFAKNSDRDANEAQALEWHPARSAGRGRMVRCTWLDIPDDGETHAVVISRPFWMWGAEMGSNDRGVTIGNEAVFTRQPYAPKGLTGMDLVRLALERSATAEDAVSVIVELLERWGQGGGCGLEQPSFTYHNSFLVADPVEAWVLETAGRQWIDERVRAGVRTISNGLTIAPFAARHRDRLRTRIAAADARRSLTSQLSPNATVPDAMAMLRLHGRHRLPRYSIINGALSGPCVHAGGVLAASQTTASWVTELRGDEMQHWVTATAAPCTSLFKPVRVDEPVDLTPSPGDHDDGQSLWWRHEHLHRLVMCDPAAAYPCFVAERDAVERQWITEPPAAADAFAMADELNERWTADVRRVARQDTRPRWVRRYWRLRDRDAGIQSFIGLQPSAS
jgi:dipeptidase